MASHAEAAYNKYTQNGNGSLVGNWNEERSLREFTGVGRRVVNEHIPKRLGQFDVPIENDKPYDNTNQRIYGAKLEAPMFSETYQIGKSSNPADALPRVGKKNLQNEAEIAREVQAEIEQKQRDREAMQETRHWDTTTATTFKKQDYSQNVIGRKVMYTQDGGHVSLNEKDDQLVVEHGTWRRLQKTTDQDLWDRIPKGDYTQQQPVTFYTHYLDRQNFYQSACVGQNPFARTSGYTQTADQVKSVSGFYGNIDFEKASDRNSFRKTNGQNHQATNPYAVKESTTNNFGDIANRFIVACKARSAANGLRCARVLFRTYDKSQDGMIDPIDFKFGVRNLGIEIGEDELKQLMKYFDTENLGKISLNDVLHAIRNGSLNEKRERCVQHIYSCLDSMCGGNESVTLACLEDNYSVIPNPEYASGQKSEAQLKSEFLDVWGVTERNAVISCAEFMDYYKDVSPSIISDDVFENMMRNTWNQ